MCFKTDLPLAKTLVPPNFSTASITFESGGSAKSSSDNNGRRRRDADKDVFPLRLLAVV